MKKMFKYASLSAIAFVGAVSFSACSSSNDVAENNLNNPDYNPATNSVKTAITLSIDPNGSAPTRMANGTVQVGASTFRGMQDIWLIPSNAVIGTGTSTASKIELGTIAATGGFDTDKDSQKTYTDKEVPVGTTNFLLLGKATRGAVTAAADKLANGFTTNNIGAGASFTAANVGAIAINAAGIAPVTTDATPALTDDWNTPAANLAAYLTTIANATGWAATGNANLQNLRNTFLNTSLTAGSSAAILLTLERLYNAVEGTDATIAGNIKTAILANLQVKSTSTAHPYELEWKSGATVSTNFPVDLGLPEGAAQYQWNTTSTAFEYVTAPTLNASNTAVMNIVYPNELYYLTSTALKATDTKTISWPTSVAEWTGKDWSSWTDNVVQPSSKNIALTNNIQYGTALLSSTVKSEASTLYDNAKAIDPNHPAANNSITVTSTTFPLTGVLVGGQPSVVGWNFLPTGTDFSKVVYDANVSASICAGVTETASAKNYTLVFDNLTSEPEQKDVLVCLEFLNNSGSDFYGSNGIILKGQKFYIVGKLVIGTNTFPFPSVGTPATPTTASDIAEKTASYYPSLTPRVFIQDFETVANFLLKAGDADTPGSLGKAIVTLPDLRSSNQTLGLSVDLSWRGGLNFDVNLGE